MNFKSDHRFVVHHLGNLWTGNESVAIEHIIRMSGITEQATQAAHRRRRERLFSKYRLVAAHDTMAIIVVAGHQRHAPALRLSNKRVGGGREPLPDSRISLNCRGHTTQNHTMATHAAPPIPRPIIAMPAVSTAVSPRGPHHDRHASTYCVSASRKT